MKVCAGFKFSFFVEVFCVYMFTSRAKFPVSLSNFTNCLYIKHDNECLQQTLRTSAPFVPTNTLFLMWILESASIYTSDTPFGQSRKVFQDYPHQYSKYFNLVDDLRKPSETIQTVCLMHKLILIRNVFLPTFLMCSISFDEYS